MVPLRLLPVFHVDCEFMDDCLEFESSPELVMAARRFVTDRLTAWEATGHADAAVLIASELVTNAVLHARTAVVLRLVLRGETIRIEVFDENPRLPIVSPSTPDATSGRGLSLVGSLSASWGMEHRNDGKVVWAEVGPDSTTTEPPGDCVDLSRVDTVEQAFARIGEADSDASSR